MPRATPWVKKVYRIYRPVKANLLCHRQLPLQGRAAYTFDTLSYELSTNT